MPKDQERAKKIVFYSDSALVEIGVLDDLVSEWFDGETENDIDEMLAICKRAQDHLKNLRANLKREAVS